MRHQSDYNSFGRLGFDPLFSVYGGQLAVFTSIIGLELAPLASNVGPFRFSLKMHRNIFANHHRPSPCDESSNTRQEDGCPSCMCSGNPKYETDGRKNTIVGTQYSSAQPPDIIGMIPFEMTHQQSHGVIKIPKAFSIARISSETKNSYSRTTASGCNARSGFVGPKW